LFRESGQGPLSASADFSRQPYLRSVIQGHRQYIKIHRHEMADAAPQDEQVENGVVEGHFFDAVNDRANRI
jgi:hypothetical protein